jgi:isoleucyl-tRNA synthetase
MMAKDNGGKAAAQARDWSQTLFLPKTDFPMRAGLPELEPRLLERWVRIKLYERLREQAKSRPKFVLHDGPPYANGNIHIGHALNKILKDIVTRSQQMLGFDSNYVPGWDCHGLPIEWKVEEDYRAKGREKPSFEDRAAANAFRRDCRAFAQHWIGVQREEFQRLGVIGDWQRYYATMQYDAEATIAAELMKFAMNGGLYRGSKPVMWSVVEQTALAEAEVEYQDYTSDTIWVKFPLIQQGVARAAGERLDADTVQTLLRGASIVIWTTTPWTIPGNRAISYSSRIEYGLYEVTAAPDGNWAKAGDRLVIAKKLVADVMKASKVEAYELRLDLRPADFQAVHCAHPLRGKGYEFDVPLLDGPHVTDEDGTGFVHTAPGHGRDDFEIWTANAAGLKRRGIDTAIPFTVDADGRFTKEAPGFTGKRVITDTGAKGDANEAVIEALKAAGMLIARGRLKHQYPHSWRSKKPVIFRNTPQWFIAMDKGLGPNLGNKALRKIALEAIAAAEFVPPAGQNRLRGMIEARPDWVISRQRAWGVPITVFAHRETGEVIPSLSFDKSSELMDRISGAIRENGADAWFEPGAPQRFLGGLVANPADWEQVTDILDVWFESGCTHAFTLEVRDDLGARRRLDGGTDRIMYLEGSDQHRGWFQSSLLESCGTRGRAPFDIVLTHGFVLDEKGQKMSKSLGNVVAPQDVMKTSGADILRLWVAASDYADDLRIGPEILKTFVETYRKVRNTLRWMLGTLAHYRADEVIAFEQMPELERLMLHRLVELDGQIREAYAAYDYKRIVAALSQFMNTDLSAFYFDVRKDALYCEPISSVKRRATLTTVEHILRATCLWLAPILTFTSDEVWLSRYPSADGSVHLELFPEFPKRWRDDGLAEKWERIKRVRRVVTGALEIERAAKRIGSSLEAAPDVYVEDEQLAAALAGVDLAEIAITSAARLVAGPAPAGAFTLPDVRGVGVVPKRAEGKKCARSWRILPDVGADPEFPELSLRDVAAVREFDARHAQLAG